MAQGNSHGWRNSKEPRYERGYGWGHAQERKRWAPIVAQGRTPCWRCHIIIKPNEKWHLGHDDDGKEYKGPEHAECNIKAASRRAVEIRLNRNPEPSPQTEW